MQAFAKVEIYSEVAEAVSVFWEFDIPSSAANAAYFFGIFSEAPEYDVEVVDVLLYLAVSGRPSENKPVANLVFNFFGVGILEAQNAVVLNKEARVKPIRLCAENFTDLAVLHAFNSFLVSSVESALYSGDNCEAFFIGFVGNFEHFAALYRVDARGFFDKQVFAGLYKFPDV